MTSTPLTSAPYIEELKKGLAALGWREGQDIEYRFASAYGVVERADAVIAELIAQKLDLLVANNSASAVAARRATRSLPIVMTTVSAPVETGLIESLARPGGNATGIAVQFEDVIQKIVETLHAIVPGARRVAVLTVSGAPNLRQLLGSAQSACAALGLDAVPISVSTIEEFAGAADQFVRQRCQAVAVLTDALFIAGRVELQRAMQSTKIPMAYGFREHVVLGGLFSYGVNIAACWYQAATFVNKILKGVNPAELPVEQPTKFEFVINLTTAKALGIVIPKAILLRADEVIQ